MSYFWWLSDQGQNSRTVVTWCPTKPQSQSCTGIANSYKTNTNTAVIVEASRSLLSWSCWQGTALRKRFPPFMYYFRWWSDQGKISCTVVMRHPTKPQSQSCAGFTNSYKTNTNTAVIVETLCFLLSQSHWQGTALRKTISPFTSYFQWLSDQGQSLHTVVTWHPTKPQSQSCTGFANSYKTNTNTAMTVEASCSLLSQSC